MPMLDLIKAGSGVDLTEHRYVIVGCEHVPGFDAVANGEPVIYDEVAPGLVELAQNTLLADPAVKAILLECTELPQFADLLRAKTGIPVYDAITCADLFMAGLLDNPRFGLQDWHHSWAEVQRARKQRRKGLDSKIPHACGKPAQVEVVGRSAWRCRSVKSVEPVDSTADEILGGLKALLKLA